MLGTLAFAVTGAAVYAYAWRGRRHLVMHADVSIFERDLSFFLVAYGLAVACTFVPSHGVRVAAALVLLGIYAWYVKITLKSGKADPASVEPLYLLHLVDAGRVGPGLQAAAAITGILAGAQFFIEGVIGASQMAGISPLILSIIITPIATELPEKFNSVIWIRQKKDTLALGNITGAMVFQSCFPVAFGLAFSPWNLTGTTMVSAVIALLSGALNLAWIKRYRRVDARVLLFGAVLYAALFVYMGLEGRL
jgi:cation:H+ antiporter